jgi:hypothetical protein
VQSSAKAAHFYATSPGIIARYDSRSRTTLGDPGAVRAATLYIHYTTWRTNSRLPTATRQRNRCVRWANAADSVWRERCRHWNGLRVLKGQSPRDVHCESELPVPYHVHAHCAFALIRRVLTLVVKTVMWTW